MGNAGLLSQHLLSQWQSCTHSAHPVGQTSEALEQGWSSLKGSRYTQLNSVLPRRDHIQRNSWLCFPSGDPGYVTLFASSHYLYVCVCVCVCKPLPHQYVFVLMVNCLRGNYKFLQIPLQGHWHVYMHQFTNTHEHTHRWTHSRIHCQACTNKYTYSPTRVNTQPDLLSGSWLLWSDLN